MRCKYVVIPQTVKVRKYEVDTEKLVKVLRRHKKISNKEIAETLNISITKVEHYFREDKYAAIPDPEIWYQLKELLEIDTDEFDKAITEFELRDGVFEKTERCYLTNYCSPTLTTLCEHEKVIVHEEICRNKTSDS